MEGSGGLGRNARDGPLWTTDTMRENRDNWNLAADVNVLRYLKNFSENLIKEAETTLTSLGSLEDDLNTTCVEISNVANKFLSLADSQFVENRVYDDEETPTPDGPSTSGIEVKSKEQLAAEIKGRLKDSLLNGFEVLKTKFEVVEVDQSESDDDEDDSLSRLVYKPINPFNARPLPHLIDSVEFMKDPTVGLKDLSEEEDDESMEEGSISESKLHTENEDSEPESERVNIVSPNDNFFNPPGMSFADHLAARLGSSRSDEISIPRSVDTDSEQENFDSKSNDFDKNSDMFAHSSKSSMWGEDEEEVSRRRVMQDLESRLAKDLSNSERNKPSPPSRKDSRDSLFGVEKQDGLFNPKKIPVGAVKIPGVVPFRNKESKDIFGTGSDPSKHISDEEDALFNSNDKSSSQNSSVKLSESFHDDTFSVKSSRSGFFDDDIPPKAISTKVMDDLFKDIGNDDNNDEDDLFGSYFKSKNTKNEANTIKNKPSTSSKKTNLVDDLFSDVYEDDLFANLNVKNVPEEDASRKKPEPAKSLFSNSDSEQDFFSVNSTSNHSKVVKEQKPPQELKQKSSSLFDDEPSDDLFSSNLFSSSKAVSKEPSTSTVVDKNPISFVEKTDRVEKNKDLFSSDLFSSSSTPVVDKEPPVVNKIVEKTVNRVHEIEDQSVEIESEKPPPIHERDLLNSKEIKSSLFRDDSEEIDDDLFSKSSSGVKESITKARLEDSPNFLQKSDDVFRNKNISPYETEPPPLFSEPEVESSSDYKGSSLFLSDEDDLFKLPDTKEEKSFKADSIFDNQVPPLNFDSQDERVSSEKLDNTQDKVPSVDSSSVFSSKAPLKTTEDLINSPLFDDEPVPVVKPLSNPEPERPPTKPKPSIDSVKPVTKPKPSSVKPDQQKPEPPKSLKIRGPIFEPDEFGGSSKDLDGVDGALFSTEGKVTSPKVIPGKLSLDRGLNINPKALLPGAAPRNLRKSMVSDDNPVSPVDNPVSPDVGMKSEEGNPEMLHSVAKDRAKIQVKRRPQTRKARHQAIRQSTIENDDMDGPSVVPTEEKSPPSVERSSTLLSPSTDEEDLFGIPPLELPPDYNKNSTSPGDIFGIPKVLSPDFIEKERKNVDKSTKDDIFQDATMFGSPPPLLVVKEQSDPDIKTEEQSKRGATDIKVPEDSPDPKESVLPAKISKGFLFENDSDDLFSFGGATHTDHLESDLFKTPAENVPKIKNLEVSSVERNVEEKSVNHIDSKKEEQGLFSSALDTDLFENTAKLKKIKESKDLFNSREPDDLFTDDSDLFGGKKKEPSINQEPEKIAKANDDLFPPNTDIFGKTDVLAKKNSQGDLFSDFEDNDLFGASSTKLRQPVAVDPPPQKSKSIFDDGDEDGDIFSTVKKPIGSKTESAKPKVLTTNKASKQPTVKTVKPATSEEPFVDPLSALKNDD